MGEVHVQITTDERFQASAELRHAIEALVDAYERSRDRSPSEADGAAEVEGYASIGSVGSIDLTKPVGTKYGPREPLSWRDGCWGFSTSGGSGYCGWYQENDDSCVSHSW
jgi:hypothetical protein